MLSKQNFIALFEESISKKVVEMQPKEFFEQYFEDLLIYFFLGNVAYGRVFFFYSFDYWKNLSYAEWEQFFLKLIIIQQEQRKSPFGLEVFIGLTYQFPQVDLLNCYAEHLKKYNKLDFMEGFFDAPHQFIYHWPGQYEGVFLNYPIDFNKMKIVGQKWQEQGAVRAIEIKKDEKYGLYFATSRTNLLPNAYYPKHWAVWVYPLMAMKYNEKLAAKSTEIKELATRRPLLAREKIELDFLQKIAAADSLELLQSIENEVNSTPTDPELIKQLLHNVSEKKGFY